MPPISVKKLLKLIHQLNSDIQHVVEMGDNIALRIAEIDYTTITTDVYLEEKLTAELENTANVMTQMQNMKNNVMTTLHRKIAADMNLTSPASLTRSAPTRSRSRSSGSRTTIRRNSA
jgi:hypothetical protein